MTAARPQSTMLFGDSMLARFTKRRIAVLEREIGSNAVVYNCAAGGWNSADGRRRADGLAALDPGVVVLSFGVNDCAPWMRVSLADYQHNLADILAAFAGTPTVGFLPPRMREQHRPGLGRRDNDELDRYRAALRHMVGDPNCLDVSALLATADFDVLDDDGVHLSDASYAALVPALGRLVATRRFTAARPR